MTRLGESMIALHSKQDLCASAPIAVFDSGVGGISVLKHIRVQLPHEHLLYFADSYYAPYGNKSAEQICARALHVAEFLWAQSAKALVVACNTATAVAIQTLRARYSQPIIGLEPAVKPAVFSSRNGIIGVLATSGTLHSTQFANLLENHASGVQVITQSCVGLVELIEAGKLETPETRALVVECCAPLLAAGVDTLVLGCTHYPLVRKLIQSVVSDEVMLIDTGAAVAKQLQTALAQALNPQKAIGQVRFYSNLAKTQAIITKLWGGPVDFVEVEQ